MTDPYVCYIATLIMICYACYVFIIHGDGVVFSACVAALGVLAGYKFGTRPKATEDQEQTTE